MSENDKIMIVAVALIILRVVCSLFPDPKTPIRNIKITRDLSRVRKNQRN